MHLTVSNTDRRKENTNITLDSLTCLQLSDTCIFETSPPNHYPTALRVQQPTATMGPDLNEPFILLGVGLAIIALRMYARTNMSGLSSVSLDDYLMVFASVGRPVLFYPLALQLTITQYSYFILPRLFSRTWSEPVGTDWRTMACRTKPGRRWRLTVKSIISGTNNWHMMYVYTSY